jgi:hypothetical protein
MTRRNGVRNRRRDTWVRLDVADDAVTKAIFNVQRSTSDTRPAPLRQPHEPLPPGTHSLAVWWGTRHAAQVDALRSNCSRAWGAASPSMDRICRTQLPQSVPAAPQVSRICPRVQAPLRMASRICRSDTPLQMQTSMTEGSRRGRGSVADLKMDFSTALALYHGGASRQGARVPHVVRGVGVTRAGSA